MFSDNNQYEMKGFMDPDYNGPRFEMEDFLMKDFGNSGCDQHHDFMNLSIPRISPGGSRSGSPDLRFISYDRMFESQNENFSSGMNQMG